MAVVLIELLRRMVELGASDLHLKAGSHPGMRIDGLVKKQTDFPVLLPKDTVGIIHELLVPDQLKMFEDEGDLDCSYAVKDLARFRVNVLTQRSSVSLVMRVIPDKIPTVEDLALPQICLDLAMKSRGLVLVTGPTGSGKSTTLAAMIDHINSNVEGHILTMEDPLEFIHPDKLSYVTQRQIGSDCKSFKQALRRGLRQDPDVILIGEMRDLETIELALTAAETGHLVMGTLHTTNAIATIDRIIDAFPSDAQAQVRVQLAGTLQGVVSQCLVNRTGGGRIAATEILIATDGVRSLIREGKTPQILNFLQTGSKHGMYTLEQSLVKLVNAGLVSALDAVAKATRPQDVSDSVQMPDPDLGQGGMDGHTSGMTNPGVPRRAAPASQPPPPAAPAPQRQPSAPPPQAAYPANPRAPGPQGAPPPADRAKRRRKGGMFDRD